MKKGDPLGKIKKIGFILLIVLVFTPLSFLVSNTITDKVIEKQEVEDCWYEYEVPYPYAVDKEILNVTNEQYLQREEDRKVCEERNKVIQDKKDMSNFIIITIINVIVIISLLGLSKKLDDVITYSMFFAAGLNTIIVVIRYVGIRSVVGVALGILLFILILLFINKKLKKK